VGTFTREIKKLPLSHGAVFMALSWRGTRDKIFKPPRFTKSVQEPLYGGDVYTLYGVGMSSGSPDHQTFSGRFHDLTRDRVQRVDLYDACDLGDEAVEQAEITSGNANDCRQGFLVRYAFLW
jgi:hypothetical protein